MDLSLSIENAKGVGPKTAEVLGKAGIKTLRDLFYTLPRAYENYQAPTKIRDIKPGKVVIKGKISDINTRYTRRRNFTVTEAVVSDNTDSVRVVWFNQPYRAKQFIEGKEYYFSGEFNLSHGRYQLSSPSATLATEVDQDETFRPIYVAHHNIKSLNFKRIISNLRPEFATIPDLLPTENAPAFVKTHARAEALFNVHFPTDQTNVDDGRRYLAYEELFELILAANLNRNENQKLKSIPLPFSAAKTKAFVENLPFKLTNAQRRATWEILQDLEKPTPMNRLLQGDVGSGKTVVAAIAAAQAAQNGHQTALLAPTAILATQHAEKLQSLLSPFGISVALLTGATKNKPELKKHILNGDVDLVVGTHAIITDDTEFKSLALCIIDEQHRFGVNQRQKLVLKSPKGAAPHLLSMTATPIPRSLQLTIFGDLDVSILNELPKGRQPIETQIISEVNLALDLYPIISATYHQKHQVYWICKAIDDNPSTETASVKKQTLKLKQIFSDAKIEFLHGRMKPAEKDEVMSRFAAGEIDILVSTTVVEVGVDVPNASIIVIQDAEQYGLAQLHQLRGRVGRGPIKSYCYLLSDNENGPSRRLKELEKSNDGFYLAEIDLKLRGPGEIYGQLQHGALDLRIASLTDTYLIALAQKQAKSFARSISQNPEIMLKYPELASGIQKYQQLTTLN